MQNNKSNVNTLKFTAGAFLEHVMPQIKISQKSFPLDGIDPETKDQSLIYHSVKVKTKF